MMRLNRLLTLAVLLLAFLKGQAAHTLSRPQPVAATCSWNGWNPCYRFTNDSLEILVSPQVGRILYLGTPDSKNLLRSTPPPATSDHWANCGGEWIWPVAQEHWKRLTGSDWPPPSWLADWNWQLSTRRAPDGTTICTLQREYPPPIAARLIREIHLPLSGSHLTIRQEIIALATSQVPIAAWNLVQVNRPDAILLPSGTVADGYRTLMFGPPDPNQLLRCPRGIIFACSRGETKLGSNSQPPLVAARKDRWLIVLGASRDRTAGKQPDRGCTSEFYFNAGLGYAELETISRETLLQPGQGLSNSITITVRTLSRDSLSEPCALWQFLPETNCGTSGSL